MEHILLKTIEGFPIITITMRKAGRGSFYTEWCMVQMVVDDVVIVGKK